MAHPNQSHRRTHNLLLVSKLLSQRDSASPFTLVLDSLEQPARCLLLEYITRAKTSRCHTIFLSFETLQTQPDVNNFIPCHDIGPQKILQTVAATIRHASNSFDGPPRESKVENPKPRFFCTATYFGETGILILIDALNTLAALSAQPPASFSLPDFLSTLLVPPNEAPQVQALLVAVYHVDVTHPAPSSSYSPTPLALVSYLATTIITVHSLSQVLTDKAARDRSLPAPLYGLNEEVEGVVISMTPKSQKLKRDEGIVIELEHRRKSGRGIHETYFLPKSARVLPLSAQAFKESIILLDDHPLFSNPVTARLTDDNIAGLTFELGLTDRQKQDREGVVLPYFDAQESGGGGGGGGRILYDMGVEDDFDEEEDEI